MNAQLNNMAQRRTWRRHAKPMSTVVGPQCVAPGADGNLWFTDPSRGSIGRITPSRQITKLPARLNPGSTPNGIAPRRDGDMWFADPFADMIGGIGPGAPPALRTPASVTGASQHASPEACQAQWSDWAGRTTWTGLDVAPSLLRAPRPRGAGCWLLPMCK